MELYCKMLPTNVLSSVQIILGNQFNQTSSTQDWLIHLSVTLTEYRC